MSTDLLEPLTCEARPASSCPLPRLLVVTYYSPAARHGGAVCVRNILDGYPPERLAWMHHERPVVDPASPALGIAQWPVGLLRRPNRFGLWRLKEYGDWTIHSPRMAREAACLARAAGIEAVLGIGPGISVWTSYLIARALGVPLHLWIHDDPAAYARFRGGSGMLVSRVRQCFRLAYRGAAVRYTISEPMREYYRKLTGCDAIVLPPSLGPGVGNSPAEQGWAGVSPAVSCVPAVSAGASAQAVPSHRLRSRRIRIGIAGSIAGAEVWQSFALALELVCRDAPADRQPEIVAFCEPHGIPVPPSVQRRGWVSMRGWQSAEVVDRELAGMDYLYMPLWFSEDRRLHVATSFSTKFVSYLRAGVPILCHVPGYSAVAAFVRRCPVGPVLDTTDVPTLADRLRAVFESQDWHSRYTAARGRALAEFDHAALVRRFHENLLAGLGGARPPAAIPNARHGRPRRP
ncbi:MAG: hypothetical protein ACPMAQ_10790 [Phycisphaerae bacterium]